MREMALPEADFKRLQHYVSRAMEALQESAAADDLVLREIHAQIKEILGRARLRDHPN